MCDSVVPLSEVTLWLTECEKKKEKKKLTCSFQPFVRLFFSFFSRLLFGFGGHVLPLWQQVAM